jgi:hypothetical protein
MTVCGVFRNQTGRIPMPSGRRARTVEKYDLVGVANVCAALASDFGRQALRSITYGLPAISKERT